ncbi:MAG: DUF1385 domain-containing protein [Fusobacterium sp.]|uniref:DUF1385 domain-containing protein n=1 Tax=Fusobacterium sp. TaxID=68766 RepID=UPI0026DD5F02|nr:DUF1385 domain-containing protein [Fusobacterium sp.]MDO4690304.1 DUF1385 domain-containing protein [Fusobacterium sp.]
MSNKVSIGGQAVIEGVMMRGTECLATAVRKPSGKIVYKKTKIIGKDNKFFKKPFIRGIVMLFESLVLGVKELTFSANQAGEEEESLSDRQAVLTTIFSLSLGIGLFIVLPSIIGGFFFADSKIKANLTEAIVRLSLFIGYIWLISFSKDVKRVFEYHGAEHKSIYAYENDMELTPENAKKFTTLHPRCGTSFLFIVMFIAIIVFSVIDFILPIPSNLFYKFLIKVILRILLMPLIASLSYELQRYSSKHLDNPLIKLISLPGLALQRITTKEPDMEELEVAIVAIKASLGQEVTNAEEVFE